MNKILKKILIGVGGIVSVLVALMAYVAATFNPNDYKPQIVQVVKDKFDRTLKIDGEITLSFFPALGADLGGLSLSEHGSDKEFAAVEKARVSLQLMPLLSRELVVSQVEVRGLRANLVKNKNGSTNIDDLSAGKDEKAENKPETKDQAEQKPIQFNIDQVLIQDAKLGYTDEASGASYSLQKFMLKTGKIAPDTASDIEIGFVVDASQPKTNLDIQLKTRAAFTPASKRFKFDDLDLGIKGEAAGMNPLTLTVKGDIEGDAKAIRSSALTIEFDAKQGEKTLKGKISTPLAIELGSQTVDLKKLLLTLDITDPKSTRGPLNINLNGSAHADLKKQRANLDFSTKLDDSTITGKAGLTHFSPPAYAFDVNIDKLDVDHYSGGKQAATGPSPAAEKPAAGQPEPALDFSPLHNLQATGSMKIGALKVANLKAQNVRVDLKANNGRLDLSPLTANLYQGTVNGSMSVVAAATPQISVKQNLAGISIGPLLKDAIDRDILEGKGSVNVDITGQGNTVSAIKKALNGSAAINLADGALKGINIAGTIRDAKAKLGALRGQATHTAKATEKTDFTELKATFAIRNGIAHNSDLSLKSPLLRLGGEGDINIGTDSMNYLAKATLVATTTGQGGKDLAALNGLTVPVRISGPYTALSYNLDYNAMIGGVAQQKIDEKKEEIKAKAQDKVKDKLKGLFGR